MATTITINGSTETGFDLPDTWCQDSGNINLSNYTAVGGGTWYLMSTNGVPSVPATGVVIPGGLVNVGTLAYIGGASVLEIRYQPGVNGCGDPMTEFVTVNSSVVADLLATPNTFCLGSGNLPFDLTNYLNAGATPGGTWTSSGPDATAVNGTTFDPSIAGTYVLTYSVSNGVCSDSESITVTVYPPVNATISPIEVCESPSGTINLVAMFGANTTPGGTWTVVAGGTTANVVNISNNVLTYTIPSTATPPYTIQVTYTVNGVAGQPAPCATATSAPTTITITNSTETGFDLPDEWCGNSGNLNLANYTSVGGGTWYILSQNGVPSVPPSGVIIPGGILNVNTLAYTNPPVGSGLPGQVEVVIRYQPAEDGCGSPKTDFITVWERVDATLDPVATNLNDEFCLGTTNPLPFDLTILYNATTTTGGVWTSSGPDATAVSGTTFNPTLPGTYVLTYTVTNGTCVDTDSYTVQVYPIVNATIGDLTVCESPSGTIDLTGLLTPTTTTGGTWSILSSSGIASINFSPSGNTLIYTINPSANPPYTINIRYTVVGGINVVPCATTFDDAVITITGATETGFDLPDVWCAADGEFDLNTYTNIGGGVWTIVSVNGITSSPLPYQVSGPGAVVNIPVIGAIAGWAADPLANFAVVDINYQPAAGGCGIPITEVITIYEDVDPSWTNPTPVCEADLPVNLSALVTGTLGGVFSGPGVYLDNNGTPADPSDDFWAWNPLAAGLIIPGSYSITYTVGFEPCQESQTHSVTVYPIITNVINPITVCESPSGTINLSAMLGPDTPAGGTWTVVSTNLNIPPIINNDVLSYFIVFADVEPYTILVQYSLGNIAPFPVGTPCNPTPAIAAITINGTDETGYDLPDVWCAADGPINLLNYTAVGGGSYALTTAPEVSIGTTFTPIPGLSYLVGITYTPIPGGCGTPKTEFVQIYADLSPQWDNPIVLCQDQLPYQLEAINPGGVWSGPGVTPSGLFGQDPQYYVIDFSSGSVIANNPSNVNQIYSYTEDNMIISTVSPSTPTNFFQFIPSGAQTDVELSTNGGNTIGTNGVRFVYNGGAPFDMVSVVLTAGTGGTNGTNGGSVFEAYVGATLVGSITVPNNGDILVNFPATFQDITRMVWRLQGGDPRTRIEEITFLDKSAPVPPGNYQITYTIGEEPCEQSLSQIIEVVPIRSTAINNITACQSPSGTVNLSAMLTPTTTPGGTWFVSSSNLAITPTITNDVLNYQISFTDVPPYQITIQYSLPSIGGVFNPGPCNPVPSTAVVTLTNVTETGYDLPDKWCVSNGPINLANYTTIGGGTYSLVTSPEIPLVGNIFIPQNGQGLVGITYTPIPNGCGTPSTEFIQIINDLNVTILPVAPLCPNGASINLAASVTTSIPYAQGTQVTYLPGTTITIPANTTVTYSVGSQVRYVNASSFIEGILQSVAAGTVRSHGPGTPVTYPNATMVTLVNGSTITYTGVTTVNSPATGLWYGNGIVNSLTGQFNPVIAGQGTHTITYVVNNNGCPVQASINITVADVVAPTFTTCPVVNPVNTTSCSGFVSVPNPIVADNCNGISHVDFVAIHTAGVLPGGVPPGVGTVINSGALFPIGFGANPLALFPNSAASGVYPVGTTTITWTVYDLAGNSTSCATNVIVTDNIAPGIFCPPNVVTNTALNQCSAAVTTQAPFTSDNCGVANVSFTALHVSDSGGDPMNVFIDPNGAAPNSGAPGTISASGTYPGGLTVVTWTATDASGNTVSCSFTVTVNDNQAPVFVTCPPNITVNTAVGPPGQLFCSAIVTWNAPVVSDNCSASVSQAIINAYQQALADLQVAQDALFTASNNLQAAINILNAAQANLAANPTNPILAMAVAMAQANVNSAQGAFNLVFALYNNALANFQAAQLALQNAQNASTLTVTSNFQPGAEFPEGVTTVVYTVTDAAGNTATCSFTVTVVDNELPTLTCPPNVTAGSIFGQCYGFANIGLPTNLSDNCGIAGAPINSYNSGQNASGIYPVGTTTVVWSVVDINGNTGTCSMTVTINDTQAPTIISCPEDPVIAAQTNAYDYFAVATQGLCSAPVTIAPLVASDNCGVQSIVNSFNGTNNASGIYPVGTNVVVWTVTDVNGNTSTCQTIVLVVDNQQPTIICSAPAPVCTSDCTNNATGEFVTVPTPTFIENCSIVSITNSYTGTNNASAVYPVGTTFVVWTIVDASGNPNSCTVPVVVNKCCQAEAGTLTVSGAQCPGDPAIGTATGFTTTSTTCGAPDSYFYEFFVVNATGTIIAINSTGNFPALGAGLAAGTYTMYGYNARVANPPIPAPAVGVNIAAIGTGSTGCYEITSGVNFVIPAAFPAAPIVTDLSQGTNGIVPTFYNVVQLEVTGGTQPYNYAWNITGYVQYAVNQNANNNGVVITVVYSDNATWSLVVTDANGCTDPSVQFDNIPDSNNTSVFLDIYDYTISSAASNASNGSITIFVEGGTTCGTGLNQYQYNWSGPSNWVNPFGGAVSGGASFTLTNLPSGWYIVEVTDCSGQSTLGWYWVPKQIRGRGKLADNQSIIAYPNPFEQQTTIEFTVAESGNANLVVYALDGKEVGTLFKGVAEADEVYSVQFNAENLPAGMYIVELTAANGAKERYKLILGAK
ncbi:MAG TPA: HYR domain-containing protein [Chitinophagales bacterium]|nr:HYR domain-containing protein [Chitinophagales bacterium]